MSNSSQTKRERLRQLIGIRHGCRIAKRPWLGWCTLIELGEHSAVLEFDDGDRWAVAICQLETVGQKRDSSRRNLRLRRD